MVSCPSTPFREVLYASLRLFSALPPSTPFREVLTKNVRQLRLIVAKYDTFYSL
jgi:hypothetical protein